MRKLLTLLIILTVGFTAFASDTIYVEMPSTYSPDKKVPESPLRISFDLGAGIGTSFNENPMKVKPVFELDITTKYKNGLGLRPVLHFDIEATDAVHLNLSLGARYYWERIVLGMTVGMDNFSQLALGGHVRYRFPVGETNYETLYCHVEGLVNFVFGINDWRIGVLGGIEL